MGFIPVSPSILEVEAGEPRELKTGGWRESTLVKNMAALPED